MWSRILPIVGIIGKGRQFLRIKKILVKRKIKYFIYKPNNKNYYDRKKFEDLKQCKIIFILSPNNTHYDYIKKLNNNRYIFCEKPPVSTKNQLKRLKKISSKKIYYNYNFRFSKIAEILKNQGKFKLGKLVYGTIVSGHGLAFKKDYASNWRSKKKFCLKGVFEVVSIHWIDLINYIFKIKKIKIPSLINLSKKGTSYDNSYATLILNENQHTNIISSYTAPLVNEKLFIFENGMIRQTYDSIEIRGPAINLNKNNFFIKPKLIKKFKIDENKDYEQSLNKSVQYFLDKVAKKQIFSTNETHCSLKSNELLF